MAERKTKEDWLQIALEVLENEGVEAVSVERLARELGTSRSGFYWHFKDRAELLLRMLDYWAHEFTEVVTRNTVLRTAPPRERLRQTMEMISEYELAKLDMPIRAWAASDENAMRAVSKVIELRMSFLREAFRDLGFKGDEVEMRARLFVCYHTWERTMFGELPKRKRQRLQKLRLEMLTQ